MKPLIVLFTTCFALQLALGQEAVPLEEAQKAARKVAEITVADAPFKVELDVDKPAAIHGEEAGLLVIPDKGLTPEKLATPSATITPLAQLWCLRVSVASDGKAPPTDKLRVITVTDGDKQREVELYFLGMRRNEQGQPELVVLGKDKEPLVRVPLTKTSPTNAQKLPIELSGRKDTDDSGTLTLRLLDQLSADLSVVRCQR